MVQNVVLNALGVSFVVLDAAGVIIEVSDTWTSFGQANGADSHATGLGANYFDVCRRAISTSPDAQHVLHGILSVHNGSEPSFQFPYRCDSDTEQRLFILVAVPHPSIPGGVVIVHKNETTLEGTDLRLSELLESVDAILWRAEVPEFKTTFASQQVEKILGFPASEWTADPGLWRRQVHSEDRDRVMEYTASETRAARRHAFEYRIIDAQGHTKWLRNHVNPIVKDGHVREVAGISIDVTRFRQAIEDRDRLAIRLLRSQEDERSAIARELHDDIGQSIALLAIRLQALEQVLPPASESATLLRESHRLIGQISRDVQRISHALHSSFLDLLGLSKAVAQHCREYAAHSNLQVDSDIAEIPRTLNKDVSISLYRVLQESLRNVSKHSNARQVSVRLVAEGDQVRLHISDDGNGFDPNGNSSLNGLGLASMSERIRLVHGTFMVVSSPGKGTEVTATVPFGTGS